MVVNKPPGLAVHGGGAGELDLVTRLAGWLEARGQSPYLGVHQRLDRGTSGVLALARTEAANRRLADAVAGRRALKKYLAVVVSDGRRWPDAGVLEHQLLPTKGEATRVVRSGGQPARARYQVLRRVGPRALVELVLETGRKHQLRAQLAAVGAPIAGDTLYGGEPAARLMLHASELSLPDPEVTFCAPLPVEIEAWLEGRAPVLEGEALQVALADAACRRAGLWPANTAFRLVNDEGDGLPGVTVDCYGEFAILAVTTEAALEQAPLIARWLVERGMRGVYLKRRLRADLRRVEAEELAPTEPLAGERAAETLVVQEGALRFRVHVAEGYSSGLFVDQRESRSRVWQTARGLRVLNLFSYTCSFSVAAAAGGAAEVVSVDLSGRALERGRENFLENGLDPAAHRFYQADVLDWLPRAARRGERFDLVVLDPPTFGTRAKARTFSVEKHYEELAVQALTLLSPKGRLLAVTNHRKTSLPLLRRILLQAARRAGRSLAQLKDLPSPVDCPEGALGPLPSKSVLVTVA